MLGVLGLVRRPRQQPCHLLLPRRFAREVKERGGFSMRAITHLLRVTLTIADLPDAKRVSAEHFAEALRNRAYEAQGFTARG